MLHTGKTTHDTNPTPWMKFDCSTWQDWSSSHLECAPVIPDLAGVFIKHLTASRYLNFSSLPRVCLDKQGHHQSGPRNVFIITRYRDARLYIRLTMLFSGLMMCTSHWSQLRSGYSTGMRWLGSMPKTNAKEWTISYRSLSRQQVMIGSETTGYKDRQRKSVNRRASLQATDAKPKRDNRPPSPHLYIAHGYSQE